MSSDEAVHTGQKGTPVVDICRARGVSREGVVVVVGREKIVFLAMFRR